ncbi:unnamed protein product [Somion occarium]|uniref:Uncharacterized protein n=1 Tax=Somion occarium TaxID=3059160 RepID=A0ABP1DHB3_9APHY
MPPPTPVVLDVSASESASLHGHRALTPLLSGAITGSIIGAAWIVGFIVYFYKRHRREKRARALGYKSHREMLEPPKKPFIVPPDSAVVEGKAAPGERIIMEHSKHKRRKRHSGNGENGSIKHDAAAPILKDDNDERQVLPKEESGSSSDSSLQPPQPYPHTMIPPLKLPVLQDESATVTPSTLTGHDPNTPLLKPPEAAHTRSDLGHHGS